MIKNVEEMQKLGSEGVDASLQSFGAMSRAIQSLALEAAGFAKRTLEEGTAAGEKLANAKSLEKVLEVQADYFKASYESLVAQSAKMGQLYIDMAQEFYKPMESHWARTTNAR